MPRAPKPESRPTPTVEPLVPYAARPLTITERGAGMRLDQFMSKRFKKWSRSTLSKHIRAGQVRRPDGTPLKASHVVREGEVLHIWIPHLAPMTPPPPFPELAYDDARMAVVIKPPGMMCHPAGDRFVYGLIGVLRSRWPTADLVHRIDKDTSGLVCVSKDPESNAFLKTQFRNSNTVKAYEAIVCGHPSWERSEFREAIGPDDGPVRIAMCVREDGLPSSTNATVLGRKMSPVGPITRVRCEIQTGRTHQIRVHLSNAGFPLLGDQLYGPGRAKVFLDVQDHGVQPHHVEQTGAPRHALHSAYLKVAHPDGGEITASHQLFSDMRRWWDSPEVLPNDNR